MISKDTVDRPFNRGRYLPGRPTPSPVVAGIPPGPGEAGLQPVVVPVPEEALAALRDCADRVVTDRDEVDLGTRDWWAGTHIAESSGHPATPDAVIVHVSDVAQVQQVVRLCARYRLPLTTSAGRSNVLGAALPVFGGVVLDVCGLTGIVAVDDVSQIVRVRAGTFGDAFEGELQKEHGLTTGHWPSAFAISTVGGWVACRGAGQLSTRYGKIEDMVVGLDVVLPDGALVSYGDYPRAALGPDLRQLFIGSEGTLGVITEVRLRCHRLPEYANAVAYGFDSFAAGLEACRQILQRGATPAVLRLYDALESGIHFDAPDVHVLLVADEGDPALVDAVLAVAEDVCRADGRELDGAGIFRRWLEERMVVGKSSEGFDRGPGFVADTLEMAGPWAALPGIYEELVAALAAVPGTRAGSAHQSHAYVDGACLYFSLRGDVDPDERAAWYRAAWDAANAVLLAHGAALSHHHGCGLVRSPYLARALDGAYGTLEAVKDALDPQGIMNPGKLGLDSPFGTAPWRP